MPWVCKLSGWGAIIDGIDEWSVGNWRLLADSSARIEMRDIAFSRADRVDDTTRRITLTIKSNNQRAGNVAARMNTAGKNVTQHLACPRRTTAW